MNADQSPTPQERVSRLASTVGRVTRTGRTRFGALPHIPPRFGRIGLALQLGSDERGELYVTAARALHQLQRRTHAERAVEHGSTLGYEVLARLRATDRSHLTRDPAGRLSGWLELRRGVRLEDRARYAGAARTPGEIARVVGTSQRRKTEASASGPVPGRGQRCRNARRLVLSPPPGPPRRVRRA